MATVSPNFFAVAGIRPVWGRLYSPGTWELDLGGVVVSEDLWRHMLAVASSLGTAGVRVDGVTFPVIGVAPRALATFQGADAWQVVDPRRLRTGEGLAWATLFVRLPAGRNPREATAQIRALAGAVVQAGGERLNQLSLRTSEADPLGISRAHAAIVVAAVMVWLAACANLAGLVLARGLRRRHVLALQLALGATRREVARQVVFEAVGLSALGAAFAVLLSRWAVQLLAAQVPSQARAFGLAPPQIGWALYSGIAAGACASAVLFGLLPALSVSEVEPNLVLKAEAASVTTHSPLSHRILAIVQVAVALVILTGVLQLWRSIRNIQGYRFGFETEGLYRVPLAVGTTAGSRDSLRAQGDAVSALARVAAIPGVRHAALWCDVTPNSGLVVPETGIGAAQAEWSLASYVVATEDLIQTLGVQPVAGRAFTPRDRLGAGAVIVDETLEARWWGAGRGVGRLVKLGPNGSSSPWVPVVGVLPRMSLRFRRDLDVSADPVLFFVPPVSWTSWAQLVLRVEAGKVGRVEAEYRKLATAGGGPGPSGLRPWTQDVENFLATRRLVALLMGVMGVLATSLSGLGLYSVLNRWLVDRRRELGLRLVFGAGPAELIRRTLRELAVMTLAGLAIGAPLAVATGQLLRSLLYGVGSIDAASLMLAEVVVVAVAAVAALGPVMSAARTNPANLLRTE